LVKEIAETTEVRGKVVAECTAVKGLYLTVPARIIAICSLSLLGYLGLNCLDLASVKSLILSPDGVSPLAPCCILGWETYEVLQCLGSAPMVGDQINSARFTLSDILPAMRLVLFWRNVVKPRCSAP
jgi:hypothetical protein